MGSRRQGAGHKTSPLCVQGGFKGAPVNNWWIYRRSNGGCLCSSSSFEAAKQGFHQLSSGLHRSRNTKTLHTFLYYSDSISNALPRLGHLWKHVFGPGGAAQGLLVIQLGRVRRPNPAGQECRLPIEQIWS